VEGHDKLVIVLTLS